MKIKCLIIDDDALARKSLERMCLKTPVLQIMALCENATEAYNAIHHHSPDLLFLDVEMPDFSGLELLDRLPVQPYVVLTSSKTAYAYDAFAYHVTDYLKKPIDFPRFKAAVDKVLTLYESQQDRAKQNIAQSAVNPEIFIRTEGRFVRLNVNEILYFENIGDYVTVRTTRGNFVIHSTMKNLDERLVHPNFVKVHRSYIVNISKIVDIEDNSLVIDKKVIPISRANKPQLIEKLNVI